MLRGKRGFSLRTFGTWTRLIRARAGAGEAPGKTGKHREGNRAKRPPVRITAGRKTCEPMADQKTAGTQASVLPGLGEATTASFENLYGLIRAAEGKVPLLMVCVKRKPLPVVFYAQLGESRSIIPRIHLCRNAGRRMGRGDERQMKRGRKGGGAVRPGGSQVHARAMNRGYARGVGGTRCGNGAISVEGCGRGGKRGNSAAQVA